MTIKCLGASAVEREAIFSFLPSLNHQYSVSSQSDSQHTVCRHGCMFLSCLNGYVNHLSWGLMPQFHSWQISSQLLERDSLLTQEVPQDKVHQLRSNLELVARGRREADQHL